MSGDRKVTRRWSGKVYPGDTGVTEAVYDAKSVTFVVKYRSVEMGVEAENSLESAYCRQGGARLRALLQESICQE